MVSSPLLSNFFSSPTKKRSSISTTFGSESTPNVLPAPGPAPPRINTRFSTSSVSLLDSPSQTPVSPTSPMKSRVKQRLSTLLPRRGSQVTMMMTHQEETMSTLSSSSSNSCAHSDDELPPPTPPPHVVERVDWATQVKQVLGSTLDDVDEEIEQEWEGHRKALRHSLQMPRRPVSML